jgi:hypothetical protein
VVEDGVMALGRLVGMPVDVAVVCCEAVVATVVEG